MTYLSIFLQGLNVLSAIFIHDIFVCLCNTLMVVQMPVLILPTFAELNSHLCAMLKQHLWKQRHQSAISVSEFEPNKQLNEMTGCVQIYGKIMKILKLLKCDSDKETFHILQDKANMVERWCLTVSNHRKCKNTVLLFFSENKRDMGNARSFYVLYCNMLKMFEFWFWQSD